MIKEKTVQDVVKKPKIRKTEGEIVAMRAFFSRVEREKEKERRKQKQDKGKRKMMLLVSCTVTGPIHGHGMYPPLLCEE